MQQSIKESFKLKLQSIYKKEVDQQQSQQIEPKTPYPQIPETPVEIIIETQSKRSSKKLRKNDPKINKDEVKALSQQLQSDQDMLNYIKTYIIKETNLSLEVQKKFQLQQQKIIYEQIIIFKDKITDKIQSICILKQNIFMQKMNELKKLKYKQLDEAIDKYRNNFSKSNFQQDQQLIAIQQQISGLLSKSIIEKCKETCKIMNSQIVQFLEGVYQLLFQHIRGIKKDREQDLLKSFGAVREQIQSVEQHFIQKLTSDVNIYYKEFVQQQESKRTL
ncbi:hypothetical protein pb186bvf_015082 [Paramecium bursaria]